MRGGIGEAIANVLVNSGKFVYSFGYRDAFIPHGGVAELMEEFGLNAEDVLRCIRECHARG